MCLPLLLAGVCLWLNARELWVVAGNTFSTGSMWGHYFGGQEVKGSVGIPWAAAPAPVRPPCMGARAPCPSRWPFRAAPCQALPPAPANSATPCSWKRWNAASYTCLCSALGVTTCSRGVAAAAGLQGGKARGEQLCNQQAPCMETSSRLHCILGFAVTI